MKEYLTWGELKALALKNYEKGGDATYECWDEKSYLEHGLMTEEEALEMFAMDKSICDDMTGYAF